MIISLKSYIKDLFFSGIVSKEINDNIKALTMLLCNTKECFIAEFLQITRKGYFCEHTEKEGFPVLYMKSV